jgi:pyruvate dehydrogenase E1 component alpha subunit
MNWAGVQRLPVIFVLENNQYAYSTPTELQYAVDPVQRAAGYGFPGVTVDGNDVEAMFAATLTARERAISGGGPTLISAQTMRMHGHAAHDDMRYVPAALVDHWRRRDPIELEAGRLVGEGVDVGRLRAEVDARLDAALAAAVELPVPAGATATDGVFCAGEAEPLGDGRAPWSGYA